MTDRNTSAIGGTQTLGAQQSGDVTYGAMHEQAFKQFQQDTSGEFIIIRQSRQSDPPKVWSSGDRDQTASLLKLVNDRLVEEPVT